MSIGSITNRLLQGFDFADFIAKAIDFQPAYLSLAISDPNSHIYEIGNWVAGNQFSVIETFQFEAKSKLAEVLAYGSDEGISTTPVPDSERSINLKGGVKFENYVVGVLKGVGG